MFKLRRNAVQVAALALLLLRAETAANSGEAGRQVPQVLEAKSERSLRLPYLLFTPASYGSDAERRWPLLLYLHGGSLRGDDVERLRKMGLPHRLESDREFPFVVVAPLCAEGEIWSDTDALLRLVDNVAREHRVDPKRIYVAGHSMGGRGALYLAFKDPERFAAVVAMSPVSPITAWAKRLNEVPLWLIHGAKDEAAPVSASDELATAIEKAGGRTRYTRLEDRDHFILDLFDKNDVFHWLLEHSK